MKTQNIKPTTQAVIYARVSTKEQEKEGYSIDAQLKLLKQYANDQGFIVVQEYIDVETAKRAGRTNFTHMLSYLKKQASYKSDNRCRIILVEKTDRLYRNLKDYVILDELDLAVHLVKEGTILSADSRSNDKFMHGIKVLMAKNYIDNLSEETKKGMYEKAAQGIYPSKAPIGYINVEKNGSKRIEPDPDMAPLVIKLFELYATGRYSLKSITVKAYEEGVVYKSSRAKIGRSQIHHILKNSIYYGDFEWGGKQFRGTHQPLICKELWDNVQDTLMGKSSCKIQPKKHSWAFQGLLKCGHCGCAMTAEIKKGKYIYYHCTGHKGKCPEKYVREEEIAKQFGEGLKDIQLDGDVLSWITSALKTGHAEQKQYRDKMITTLQQQYTKIQNRLDQMYIDKLDGNISTQFYDQKRTEWQKEMSQILKNIEMHQNASNSCVQEGIRILELANRAWELYEKQEMTEKRRLLDYVFSNSSWMGGRLTPNYRKPFDLIVEARQMQVEKKAQTGKQFDKEAKNEKWLPRLDSNQRHSD